jgi:hypothetical protein
MSAEPSSLRDAYVEKARWERYVATLEQYQEAYNELQAANGSGDGDAVRRATLALLAVDKDVLAEAWQATEGGAPAKTPWEDLVAGLGRLRAYAVESGWLKQQVRVIDGRVRGRVLRELS